MTFDRGLTPAFVEELKHGRFAPLLSAAKEQGLDIQIRSRYPNRCAQNSHPAQDPNEGRVGRG